MKEARLLAIGGGKGGSGKSFLALNIGVALAEEGKEVVLFDADLGGANLHTMLGISFPSLTLEDFLLQRRMDLREVSIGTAVKGLRLIAGPIMGLLSNLKYSQRRKLFRNLKSLQTDYVIIDLGANVVPSTLDLFLLADRGLLLLTPEPTSIENAYRFLRGVYFRGLSSAATERGIKRLIRRVTEHLEPESRAPLELLKKLEALDGATASRFREVLKALRPCVVLNQVKRREEITLGFSVKSFCRRYFGLEVSYLGHIPYDPKVTYSVEKGRPFLWEYPATEVSRCIREIAHRIQTDREVPHPQG